MFPRTIYIYLTATTCFKHKFDSLHTYQTPFQIRETGAHVKLEATLKKTCYSVNEPLSKVMCDVLKPRGIRLCQDLNVH